MFRPPRLPVGLATGIPARLAPGPNPYPARNTSNPHCKKKQGEKESFQRTHSSTGCRHNRYPYLTHQQPLRSAAPTPKTSAEAPSPFSSLRVLAIHKSLQPAPVEARYRRFRAAAGITCPERSRRAVRPLALSSLGSASLNAVIPNRGSAVVRSCNRP